MPRFSFPIPGRKKREAAPVAKQEATSKAHKLLGSAPLNIDAPTLKNWDVVSNSGISVTITDAHSPTYTGQSRDQHAQYTRAGPAAEWGDDSEILPRHLRSGHLNPNDDAYSEVTTALRSRQSSSTIKSWYDKSTQPLSVTQQTSASAMAQGFSSKAHRMLDMDNSLAPQRTKKKPARLDLSHLTPGGRSKPQQTSDDYVLGPDMVTKSPSVLSQLSPSSGSGGRRLQKRPTKESLRQQPSIVISDPIRPSTAGSGRFLNHPNGVPDLYGHYEQMSLRQIMDLESHDIDEAPDNSSEMAQQSIPNPSITRTSPSRRRGQNHAHTASHSTHSSKLNHHSPSASVSSRHTRTSKASKRTDLSFQDADLHGKSVLSLSSDSEDDDGYGDAPMKSPTSVFARRPSDFEEHAASLASWQQGSSLSPSVSPESRTKAGKRASFAPFHTYLPVPGETPKPAPSSLGTSPSAPSLLQAPSPARASSDSSASSALTWQSNKPGYGVQEARAITMLPAQGPTEQDSPLESGSDWEHTADTQRHSSATRGSVCSTNDQPTPPLSPSSVDFYIRSAHSSIDGPSGGHNRFMAVSKQEELLLAALRHKRQLMRESFIAEEVSARIGRHSRKSSKGHKTKHSTATITQDLFNFDFPTPPKANDDISRSSSESSGMDRGGAETTTNVPEEESIGSILFPAPQKTSRKSILKVKTEQGSTQRRRSSHQSEDWPISPRTLSPLPEASQKTDTDVDADWRSNVSYGSDLEDNEQILLPTRYSAGAAGRRKSSQALPGHGHRSRPSVVPEEPNSPAPNEEKYFEGEDAGVPRPDSPIAPESFPAIPTSRVTVNKKLARLSAVGSAPLGSQPGWWGDDD